MGFNFELSQSTSRLWSLKFIFLLSHRQSNIDTGIERRTNLKHRPSHSENHLQPIVELEAGTMRPAAREVQGR